MALYDCFMYADEDILLDLRLNILNDYVDYFVLVEGKKNHQGKNKKLNFDIKKFNKFKHKIRYIFADKYQDSNYTWYLENYQRNFIIICIEDAANDSTSNCSSCSYALNVNPDTQYNIVNKLE